MASITDMHILFAAKHLEPLKGGKIPVEILVTSKTPDEKMKSFEKCIDVIKNAGVSPTVLSVSDLGWN